MVKFMKQFVILFIIILISSCVANNKLADNDTRTLSKRESFGYVMYMLIDYYIEDHSKSPSCVKDLLTYIESMDEESKNFYQAQYEYLKKHEKKIIFISEPEKTDSGVFVEAIAMYYKKLTHKKLLLKLAKYDPILDENK